MSKDYKTVINIKEELYNRWKQRIRESGISNIGHLSKQTPMNSELLNWAIENIPDEAYEKILKIVMED